MTDEANTEDEISQVESFKQNARKPRNNANKVLADLTITNTADTSHISHQCNGDDRTVKLSKLEIPEFKGDLTQWTTFRESYEA